jgi:hypothetical protein
MAKPAARSSRSSWRSSTPAGAPPDLSGLPRARHGRDAGQGLRQILGCASANFSEAQKATRDRTPGDGWFITRGGAPGEQISLVHMDTDRWKAWEHDRWMTDPGQVGALTLFGQPSENTGYLSFDQKSHWQYARHITAEVEAEEIVKGALRSECGKRSGRQPLARRQLHERRGGQHLRDQAAALDRGGAAAADAGRADGRPAAYKRGDLRGGGCRSQNESKPVSRRISIVHFAIL